MGWISNITADSAPSWPPSAVQEAQVPQVVEGFLTALDAGQYTKAYDPMTEGQQKLEMLETVRRTTSRPKSDKILAGASG